jgi:hypothetical protein
VGIAEDIERELSTDHRARQRAREDILLRFMELSWQDQYKHFEVIQGYFFHDAKGRTAAVLREARGRAACIEAVQRAARHLGLPAGEAPGVEEYDRAQAELGLDIPSGVVRRRWHSWPEVRKAVRGEPVRLTARQRAGLRAAIRRRHTGEEWLEGVREWLREGGRSTCREDYDAWAQERDARSTGEAGSPRVPPVALSHSIAGSVLLPWSAIVHVARGDVSLADAQAEELRRLEAEDGEFVALRCIALLHGLTHTQATRATRREGFPAHAFTLYGKRVWRLGDVRAHHAGEPFPSREKGELQGHVMSSTEVSSLLGLDRMEMIHAVAQTQESPPRVGRAPRPAGKVASQHYWWRLSVEAWQDLGCGPARGGGA